MEIKDVIFTSNLPRIDLHGYIKEEVSFYVNEFINDSVKLKHEFIIIIHGMGENILSKEVHNTLSKNRNIENYKFEYNNSGSTIAKVHINQ